MLTAAVIHVLIIKNVIISAHYFFIGQNSLRSMHHGSQLPVGTSTSMPCKSCCTLCLIMFYLIGCLCADLQPDVTFQF